MSKKQVSIPDEAVISKIYEVRGQKVMIDRDLAELYGVETRRLKEQVRRNKDRFPDDFMFEMNKEEFTAWREMAAISDQDKQGLRYAPFCFTEHGVLMLSSVLNSKQAIQVNIQIMRVYTRMKKMLLTHKDLLVKMNELESKVSNQEKSIKQVFAYLRQFVKEQEEPREPIGFKPTKKKK